MGVSADVIVIGGGAAGLSAATELANSCSVLLLEARERFGGRIWSAHEPGRAPRELGAEFVQGSPKDVLRWLKRAGAKIENADGTHLFREPRRWVDATHAMKKAVQALGEAHGPDEAIESYIQGALPRRSLTAKMARTFAEGFYAADPRRASTQAIATMTRAANEVDGDGMYRVRGGYDRLIDVLVRTLREASVPCLLGREIMRVDWKPGRVRVRVRHRQRVEEYSARAAIITVPVPWLQSHGPHIHFAPELPAQSSIDALAMGSVSKVFLRLHPETNLLKRPFVFLHAPKSPFPTFWTLTPFDPQTIVAWAAGPKDARLSALSDVQVIATAKRALEKLCGKRDLLVESADCVRWSREHWTRGAYAVVPTGTLRDEMQLAKPVADTLFFAGEATEPRFAGTVQGALRSGVRAARECCR